MSRSQCCMCDAWIDKPPCSVCDDCLKPSRRVEPPHSTLGAGGVPFSGPVWSTKASPVEELTAAFEQFRRDHPPPEPFTMRQIAQAIRAAQVLGILPEDLLRALGQYPLPEPERLTVLSEPTMPPDEMRWVTASMTLPVVIHLDADDVPPPSTESEDNLKARVMKHAAEHYGKVTLP